MSVEIDNFFELLVNNESALSVIGLGYVGLPLAQAFSEKGIEVIGYDSNLEKINQYKNGEDLTNEVGKERLSKSSVNFTSEIEKLKQASFHIIAVPTPIYDDNLPDFRPLEKASQDVGTILKKGDYVVYESTVYPGLTRELCIPILENISGLKCPNDFKVGYSPERINPGDKKNTLEKIIKVVSGVDDYSLEVIANVYGLIIEAGIHKAESIEVAEASKIIENAQRDVNIAFMNEVSRVFNKMSIPTNSVLEAASTKWNFLNFKPGLVGGHCIGVDPYYLIYKAKKEKIKTPLLESSRDINDAMEDYVVSEMITKIFKSKKNLAELKIGVLGVTFKENTPDLRNSKAINIIEKIKGFGIEPIIYDPHADNNELITYHDFDVVNLESFRDLDILAVLVAHKEFEAFDEEVIMSMLNKNAILFDLKSIFIQLKSKIDYWSL
ncbi:nucleotide sugar dehydrogenase [Erysipelothrix anatis]|uniref:nucleotide sugar dehydrogenase n=1 Tax=Erysipelothrix anatis TaxID=2683713 RepID=UPI00135AEC92|nr:nucleotide sugar dehydrogenase [Erysipelothrix anatis]